MTLKELRTQYNNPTSKQLLKDNLGDKCANCGSCYKVEYHHIVPLALGGTNKLSNIVPLCYQCHKAAHHGQHITKYRKHSENYGRPSPLTYEQAEPILEQYFLCKIWAKECWKKLGYTGKVKLAEKKYYKRYKDEHGVVENKNNIDMLVARMSKKYLQTHIDTEEIFSELEGRPVGYIKYNSGKTEVLIYSPQEKEKCRLM